MFTSLFIYGDMMGHAFRENILGRPCPYMAERTVSGYEVEENGNSFPPLIKKEGSIVKGGVIVVHEQELSLLDELDGYERKNIYLNGGGKAWACVKSGPDVDDMEEKVLYNVLRQVKRGESLTSAPDEEYVKALEVIGIIRRDWEDKLTSLGDFILKQLEEKLNPW